MYRRYKQSLTMSKVEKTGDLVRREQSQKYSHEEIVSRIASGDYSVAHYLSKNVLSVFISSTFTDTKAERNYLLRHVWPDITKVALQCGIEFSVVDLRWGIRDHAVNDHSTTEICLAEIERCAARSIDAPCFLYLAFDKYGCPSLPRQIPVDEFEDILRNLKDKGCKSALSNWYRKDENALLPVFVLQPISAVFPEYAEETDLQKRKQLRQKWFSLVENVQKPMLAAVENCAFAEEAKLKYIASTTHLEVQKGILASKNAKSRSICYKRVFAKLPTLSRDAEEKRIIGRYFDVDAEGNIGANERLIRKLRRDVLETGSVITSFAASWHPQGVEEATHGEYLEQFGKCVREDFTKYIKEATLQRRVTKNCVQEAATHLTFCATRSNSFHGREELVRKTMLYVQRKKGGGSPFIVYGDSGAGKTSLLAKLTMVSATTLSKGNAKPVLITRFCGTSPMSSSAPDLVQSILEQMSEVYHNGDLPPRLSGFKTLYTTWHNAMKQATCSQPVLFVIDSIDQLNDDSNGRSDLAWLPDRLPSHVYMVVSTLPHIGGCFSALKKKKTIPETNFLQVEALSMQDASNIITGWLHEIDRTLNTRQLAKLTKMATDTSAEKPSALRLKLLFDKACKWASFQDPPDFPLTVKGLIGSLFQELESDHGKTLVSHFCGIIGMSRHGLSEFDMKDILSGDEEVLDHVFQYHKPSMRRIPDIVFARLLNSLRGYIVLRSSYQKTVLYWYHRQFWTAAEERYLSTKDDKEKYAALIAEYFNNDMQRKFPERNLLHQPIYFVDESNTSYQFNQTKLEQLPRAFVNSNNKHAIDQVIFNLSFLAAKIESGMGRNLLYEFSLIPYNTIRQEAYKRFITANLHILEKFPSLIYQRSKNTNNDNPMQADVASLTYGDVLPWMQKEKKWNQVEYLNKPYGSDPCTMVIESTVRVTYVTFSKLHTHILTLNTKGSVVIWDPRTGKLITTLDYGSPLLAFCTHQVVSDKVSIIAACSDGNLCVRDVQVSGWDARIISEKKWKAYNEGMSWVSIALSNSGQHVLTATLRGKRSNVEELKLWSLQSIHEAQHSDSEGTVKPIRSIDRASSSDRKEIAFKICQLLFSPDDQHFVVVFGVHGGNSPVVDRNLITINDVSLHQVWAFEKKIQVPKSVAIFQHPADEKNPNLWCLLVTSIKSIHLIKVDTSKSGDEFGIYAWKIETRDPLCCAVVSKKHPVILCGMFNDIMVWGLPSCSTMGEVKKYKVTDVFQISGKDGPESWESQFNNQDSDIYQYGFLRGHNRTVKGISLGANDTYCTVSQDGELRLWDLEAFYNFKTPPKHDRSLRAMALSPDNKTLYTASLSGDIKIWNSMTGNLKKTILVENFDSGIASMAISPDNMLMCCVVIDSPNLCLIRLVSEEDGFLDLEDVKEIHLPLHALSTGTGDSGKHSVKFSSDGTHILGTVIRSRQAFLFNVMKGKMTILAEHHSPIRCPNFTPDGKLVVTNSYGPETDMDHTFPCKIYNIETKEYCNPKPTAKRENFWDILNVAFLKSGDKFLASTSQKGLELRNFPTFDVVQFVENAHGRTMRNVIVVQSAEGTEEYGITSDHDGFVKVWTLPKLNMVAMFCNDVPINSIVAHVQGDGYLYICCGDIMGNVKILRIVM